MILNVCAKYTCSSTTSLLLDRNCIIIAVLVGHPKDIAGNFPWKEVNQQTFNAVQRCKNDMKSGSSEALPKPPSSDGRNRRGEYYTSSQGPSYSGGQQISFFCLATSLY